MKRYQLFERRNTANPYAEGDSLMELRQDLLLQAEEGNVHACVVDSKTGRKYALQEAKAIADKCYQEREQKRIKEEKAKHEEKIKEAEKEARIRLIDAYCAEIDAKRHKK